MKKNRKLSDLVRRIGDGRISFRLAEERDLPIIREWWKDPSSKFYFNRRKTFTDKGRIKLAVGALAPPINYRPREGNRNLFPDEIPMIVEAVFSDRKPAVPIGIFVLEKIDWGKGEASFRIFVDSRYRRLKYGLEMMILIFDFVFTTLEFTRLYASTISRLNDRTEKFMIQVGFRLADRIKKYVKRGDERYDLVTFEIFPHRAERVRNKFQENRDRIMQNYRVYSHEGSL
ncbi:MAG: GNAT family protein [bacterium]|nr:GNAT family protein [bacterium]